MAFRELTSIWDGRSMESMEVALRRNVFACSPHSNRDILKNRITNRITYKHMYIESTYAHYVNSTYERYARIHMSNALTHTDTHVHTHIHKNNNQITLKNN